MSKFLYILIGPQGSGKTYYAERTLQGAVRVSQDDQGKAGHFEAFEKAFKAGSDIVVDRINHLREQRRRYTENARKSGYRICFIWFDADRQLCMNRLAHRKDHPTIRQDRDNHERILATYFRDFEHPEHYEYDEITVITRRQNATMLDLRPQLCHGYVDNFGDRKFIVVGDIHGCFDEFIALLEKCNYRPGDYLISVGDLMDRGPKSRNVIEWFMAAENVFVTEGNHDNKARRYWKGRRVKVNNGLDKTIEQCKDMDTAAIAGWIESFPQIIQLPNINGKPTYVVHAGVDGKYPIDRQPVENCLYARYFGGEGFLDKSGDIWYTTLDGSYNVISGHMIHAHPTPTEYGDIDYVFLLDGGAYQGGELRALVVEDGKHRIEAVQSPCYTIEEPEVAQGGPMFAVAARDELIDQGLLRCDDKGDLRIYNYTQACLHSGAWNPITTNSRGIVLNRKTGEVVARPFPKFFNVGERQDTFEDNLPWDEGFTVFEKLDGWLGTLYRYEGEYYIATRGSFDGMGAAPWATKRLRTHNLTGLPDEATLIFELICPQTKIIVDYGDKEDLVLLAAYNRHTGEEYAWSQVETWGRKFGFTLPKIFGSDLAALREFLAKYNGKEAEGFVIRFTSGLRVKMKGEDYIKKASLMSNMTPLALWKAMEGKNGEIDPSFREAIDADWYELFDSIAQALRDQYQQVLREIETEYLTFERIDDEPATRKTFALAVQRSDLKHKKCMFSKLDGKSIDDYIWRQIRPTDNELKI